MSATSVEIKATYADNKPLKILGDLIAKREKYLKGETTENAVTATAINVVKSLRAETVVAPLEARDDMIKVELVATNGAGWRGHPARRKATPDGKWDRTIRPVNLMYNLTGEGHLYKISIVNPNLVPKKSLNKPVYYVLAPNPSVAWKYGVARVTRALKKEAGMSRYAVQMSMAKIYDRSGGEAVRPFNGNSRQMLMARGAVTITRQGNGFSNGKFGLSFVDSLRYSLLALKHGPAALGMALMKAANSTAAIINKMGNVPLGKEIPTPFPEIKGKR